MNNSQIINKIMIGLWLLFPMALIHAGTPLWTFTPITATKITLATNDTATVDYVVTNQSRQLHTLVMKAIPGVTQVTTLGNCPNPFVLRYKQSCNLKLSISGRALDSNLAGGPIACQQGNPNQCYQTSSDNSLHITKGYTLGGNVVGLSGTLVLRNNGADELTINADGSVNFPNALAPGAFYQVSVYKQPATQTCTVSNGSGNMGSVNVTNIGVNCSMNQGATLRTSKMELALSVTGLKEYGINGTPSSGLARQITITNDGPYPAVNLLVTPPVWPKGTTNVTTCGSTLGVGSSCTITVQPYNEATSDGSNPCSTGTAPVPGIIQVSADNAAAVPIKVIVLSYGCIYQGGYVYAFDDTPIPSQSVVGKVVTSSDQSNGINWNYLGNYTAIYAISEKSNSSAPDPSINQITVQQNCDGATNGSCNTNNIYLYYQNNNYAVGLCKQTIPGPSGGYTDWYLPAICEMGYGDQVTFCGTQSTPLLQNIQSNLVELNNFSTRVPSGDYWSSTEDSSMPDLRAWYQSFGQPVEQNPDTKDSNHKVLCSRALTDTL